MYLETKLFMLPIFASYKMLQIFVRCCGVVMFSGDYVFPICSYPRELLMYIFMHTGSLVDCSLEELGDMNVVYQVVHSSPFVWYQGRDMKDNQVNLPDILCDGLRELHQQLVGSWTWAICDNYHTTKLANGLGCQLIHKCQTLLIIQRRVCPWVTCSYIHS